MPRGKKISKEKLEKLYLRGDSHEEIAKKLGLNKYSVSQAVKRFGLKRPKNTNRKLEAHNRAILLDKKKVIRILLLRIEGYKYREISEIMRRSGVDIDVIYVGKICRGDAWNDPEFKAAKFLRNKIKTKAIDGRKK